MTHPTPDWRACPSPAEVKAHAEAHPSGTEPWCPSVEHNWTKRPMVAVGNWICRSRPKRGVKLRAHFGWIDGERIHVNRLGSTEGQVWYGVSQLTVALDEARWIRECEFRPVDVEGMAVPWPEVGS